MMPCLLSSGSPTSSNRSDNSYICSRVGVSTSIATGTGTDAPVPPPLRESEEPFNPSIGKSSYASEESQSSLLSSTVGASTVGAYCANIVSSIGLPCSKSCSISVTKDV